MHNFLRRILAAGLVAYCALPGIAHAAGGSTLSGTVIDQSSGLPVAEAKVEVDGPSGVASTVTTDASGAFSAGSLASGAYTVLFSARGYEISRSEPLFVAENSQTTIHAVLVRSQQPQSSLREIATVRTSRAASLQTSSVITERISTQKIIDQGMINVGQGLLTLPGFSANDLDSAPGDDLHLQIRGQKASETAALLDGHPIGPIGVQNGFRSGFNYQLSPAWGLSNTEVAYASGGEALYGVDTIGGAVNFQTIEAGGHNQAAVMQGFGGQGRATTMANGSGALGNWDYAFAYGVQGSNGPFNGSVNPQLALMGQTNDLGPGHPATYIGDLSPSNFAANTWRVTGDYLLRSGVLKARYHFNPTTSVTFTAYNATSFDDKTGEGDNDSWTPEYTGYYFDQNIAQNFPGQNCLPVKVSDAGATQCYTRNQWIAAFAGPAGGTSTAWQTQRLQDYSARLLAEHKNNVATASLFVDQYSLIYNRNDSGHTNMFNTYGLQVADDIVTGTNDFGVGAYGYNQVENDNQFSTSTPGNGVSYFAPISASWTKFFVRDTWTPNARFSAFFTGWLNQNSTTNTTSFDPRLTLVVRPSTRDVVRFSVGRAQGVPLATLVKGAPQFNNAPNNITTAACGPNDLNSVANSANPTLQPEKATDFEASIGHRFAGDSQIQLTGFSTFETNAIFGNNVPLTTLGFTPPANLLNQYISIISGLCGHPITIANLAATTTSNAGTGRYRGFTLSGRQRLNRSFLVDYGYNVVDARLDSIPDIALQGNATLIPGAQIDKVPVHTANLGVEYAGKRGLSARMDGYYVGTNNGLVHPAYAYANGSISQNVKNLTFTLGAFNIFNSHFQQYGEIGYGTYQPENKFFSDPNVLAQGFNGNDGEQFGLPHSSFFFSVTEKI